MRKCCDVVQIFCNVVQALWWTSYHYCTTVLKKAFKFCAGPNVAYKRSEICHHENFWHLFYLGKKHNTYHCSTILQKQFIAIIFITKKLDLLGKNKVSLFSLLRNYKHWILLLPVLLVLGAQEIMWYRYTKAE